MEMDGSQSQSTSRAGSGEWSAIGPLRFAAASFMIAAAALAANQIPTADPYNPPGLGTRAWFLAPIEINAVRRLPTIDSDLYSVYAHPSTRDVWIAGRAGTLLHSDDSGSTWKQLKIRYSPQKSSLFPVPPQACQLNWSLIPSAEAAQAQKPPEAQQQRREQQQNAKGPLPYPDSPNTSALPNSPNIRVVDPKAPLPVRPRPIPAPV